MLWLFRVGFVILIGIFSLVCCLVVVKGGFLVFLGIVLVVFSSLRGISCVNISGLVEGNSGGVVSGYVGVVVVIGVVIERVFVVLVEDDGSIDKKIEEGEFGMIVVSDCGKRWISGK